MSRSSLQVQESDNTDLQIYYPIIDPVQSPTNEVTL